jgi:pantothenate kinase
MTDAEEKKRTSARLSIETLDKIESYQERHNLNNRSEAIEHIVDDVHELERTSGKWEQVADQLLHLATVSTTIAVVAIVMSVLTAVITVAPLPSALVSASAALAASLVAGGSTLGRRVAIAQATRQRNGATT